jgi:thioredoxin-like negative regulator of GroEL
MDSVIVDIIAAGAGALIAWLLTRAPELRGWRLSQMILVAGGFATASWLLRQTRGEPDMGAGIVLIVIIVLTAFLLAPNIAFYCGVGLSNFLDPLDWTPAEEKIALRPIRRLIDNDQFYQAVGDLEALLEKHQPTYEALILHAKLLHHFGRLDATAAALLRAIQLSHTAEQQLTVMELLAALEDRLPAAPKPAAPGTRRINIRHELALFPPGAADRLQQRFIPPGDYEVEEMIHGREVWLKLAGEDWGNAKACWEAVLEIPAPAAAPSRKGIFWQIGRMHQAISVALKGKPRHQRQAEADRLLKEANQFIRREDWPAALPLLQKALTCDPHRYEIAYRWVQAVRQTGDPAAAARAINKVLAQSQWSATEQEMLRQLQHQAISIK